jgi:isocitrate dehydrogenase (NAD+)
MFAVRNFATPARQCLRSTRVAPNLASTRLQFRCYSAAADERVAKFKGQKGSDGKYTVTLIEGDGIGPEISQSVKDIFSAANVTLPFPVIYLRCCYAKSPAGPYQVGVR